MSFFGKKFKKVSLENIIELMDALNVSEKIRALLSQTDALSSFKKNDDGTLQYIIEKNGNTILTQSITLGAESDFVLPDGTVTKNVVTLEGDSLKTVLTFPDGRIIRFERNFRDNELTLVIDVEGIDLKGTVKYVAV